MLVQHVAMVVARTVLQLLERLVDAFSHRMRRAEIHRCACHLQYLARWDGILVNGQVVVGIDGNDVIEYGRGRIAYASQIEESVVGEVQHRGLVGGGFIGDVQTIVGVGQFVHHVHRQIAWETFLAIGRYISENDF